MGVPISPITTTAPDNLLRHRLPNRTYLCYVEQASVTIPLLHQLTIRSSPASGHPPTMSQCLPRESIARSADDINSPNHSLIQSGRSINAPHSTE
ncbi:hypothetical protein TNCT_252921 [Trichonephila clavata]|uniref:Uncharacterized protein n=1 Tax=Trichonephila clavata TaxID=2740835 RepID=A0A8X6K5B9_TRICU|nr:hypothetical protein TNCT_252921 [Trichonephila clavata]